MNRTFVRTVRNRKMKRARMCVCVFHEFHCRGKAFSKSCVLLGD